VKNSNVFDKSAEPYNRSGFAGIDLQAPVASRQAVRVLLFDEADRVLLLSVMSLVGATAGGLAEVIDDLRTHGSDVVQAVIDTGDLPTELSSHAPMHMYRWSELRDLLERHPCRIVTASASGLSYGRVHRDLHLSLSEEERERLTAWEIDLAAEPGAIGIGEHIIAVVQKEG